MLKISIFFQNILQEIQELGCISCLFSISFCYNNALKALITLALFVFVYGSQCPSCQNVQEDTRHPQWGYEEQHGAVQNAKRLPLLLRQGLVGLAVLKVKALCYTFRWFLCDRVNVKDLKRNVFTIVKHTL